MKKINSFVDKLVYQGDKESPDTFRKGRFFVVSMLIFSFISIAYFPTYLGDSVETVPLVKPLYYISLIILVLIFLIYPRYGYRNLLFILFVFPSAASSFISVYYTTGGLFSSDIGLSVVMILFVFMVTNKTLGVLSAIIHILVYIFFYYAAINKYRDFMADVMALGTDYYLSLTVVCFIFATIMILLHEDSKDKYLSALTKAKSEIENQKAEIVSSIVYAKRIQEAKLPEKTDIYDSFPNSFVLFKPKDIVSGDFYFLQKEDNLVFLAAADCTGHGVPGALLSMLGSELLREEITQNTEPATVLSQLNKRIKSSLRQSNTADSTKDGMDIALCAINTDDRRLKYAGANRPLWIIANGQIEVQEIKPTKKAIGGFTEQNQNFESTEITLQKGDTFYIFTDGYADQFGGQNGKKLMTKKLKEILLDIQHKTMEEQEKYLNDFIENWKVGTEQVDDMLIIGVRV